MPPYIRAHAQSAGVRHKKAG